MVCMQKTGKEVQLNKDENRWMRPLERELSEEEKETVEVFRKFQATAGFRPQRWGSKPQGSATLLLEAKGDRTVGRASPKPTMITRR